MVFISAQPDDFYFVWQLELQIRNFSSLGIAKSNYHILIGVDPKKGLSYDFQDLIKKYSSFANFFIYNDTRKSRNYIPSLRPHILKKHYIKYPDLSKQSIFYHDSDILFRKLPINDEMVHDDVCYLSDTRSYLDTNYVIETGGKNALEAMCSISGIKVQQAVEYDAHCGGAQYLLKHVDYKFWSKIEKRCENIYTELCNINISRSNELLYNHGVKRSDYKGIQAWCADMWAIFYTLIEEHQKIMISDSMHFCWADSPLEEWEKCSILHYTGNQKNEETSFKKSLYTQYLPQHDWNLRNISPKTCSIKVVEQIIQLRETKHKYDLYETLFIIHLESHANTTLVIEFLLLYFQIHILIVVDNKDVIAKSDTYSYLQKTVTLCSHEVEDIYVESFKSKGVKYVVRYAENLIIHPNILYNAIVKFRDKGNKVSILPSQCYVVDKLMVQMFQKMKVAELLCCNVGKFIVSQDSHCIECYAIEAYLIGETLSKNKIFTKKIADEYFVLN